MKTSKKTQLIGVLVVCILIIVVGTYLYTNKSKNTQIIPIKVGGVTAGYAVVPSNAIIGQEYDQKVATGIAATIGPDGMAHYTDTFTGTSITYDPKQAVVIPEDIDVVGNNAAIPLAPGASKGFAVFANRQSSDGPIPSVSLTVSGIEMKYAGNYASIDALFKKLSANQTSIDVFRMIDLNGTRFIEEDVNDYADGKTQGRIYYALHNNLIVRIDSIRINDDASSALMSNIFNTLTVSNQ